MSRLAFAENERVLCFHGPLMYEAKVLKAEMWNEEDNKSKASGPHYLVHYKGWKVTWDEYVPESRLLKLNDANQARQKQLQDAQRIREKAEREAAAAKAALEGGSISGPPSKKKPAGDSATAAASSAGTGRGTKRGRDSLAPSGLDGEEEWQRRPEIKLNIPDVLKVQLVDDWEAVTKNSQLVPLPREQNVQKILKAYETEATSSAKPPRSASLTHEVVAGLQLYFDKSLGNNLLYRLERMQYGEQRKKAEADDTPMSAIYGAEHLLRLFVNLPELIAHTTMDTDSVSVLREALGDMLKWLAREQKKYLLSPLEAYENTSAAYQNVARA